MLCVVSGAVMWFVLQCYDLVAGQQAIVSMVPTYRCKICNHHHCCHLQHHHLHSPNYHQRGQQYNHQYVHYLHSHFSHHHQRYAHPCHWHQHIAIRNNISIVAFNHPTLKIEMPWLI